MKSANAPFNEFGQSMILRDIEDLYIDIDQINSGANGLQAQVTALSKTITGLSSSVSGLGTMSVQNANAVAITGGTAAGLTITTTTFSGTIATLTAPLSVGNGGTGLATVAQDRIVYTSALDTFSATAITSFGRLLIACADAAAGRTQLALGTIATQNANAVAITGGSITGLATLTTPNTATLQLLGATGANVYFGMDASYTRLNFNGASTGSLSAGDSTSRGVLSQSTTGSFLSYTTSGSGTVTYLEVSSTGCNLAAGPVAMALTSQVSISATVSSGASLTLGTANTTVTTNAGIFYYQATVPDFRLATIGAGTIYGRWTSSRLVVGASTSGASTTSLSTTALEIGGSIVVDATTLNFSGTRVVTTRQSAVTAPSGGATVDSQARTAINDIISRLQSHGLIS